MKSYRTGLWVLLWLSPMVSTPALLAQQGRYQIQGKTIAVVIAIVVVAVLVVVVLVAADVVAMFTVVSPFCGNEHS